jgi:hypothetical protein
MPGWIIIGGYFAAMFLWISLAPLSAGLTKPLPTLGMVVGSLLAIGAWSLIIQRKLLPLGVLGVLDSVTVAVVALIVGICFYGEIFSPQKLLFLGIALCFVLLAQFSA